MHEHRHTRHAGHTHARADAGVWAHSRTRCSSIHAVPVGPCGHAAMRPHAVAWACMAHSRTHTTHTTHAMGPRTVRGDTAWPHSRCCGAHGTHRVHTHHTMRPPQTARGAPTGRSIGMQCMRALPHAAASPHTPHTPHTPHSGGGVRPHARSSKSKHGGPRGPRGSMGVGLRSSKGMWGHAAARGRMGAPTGRTPPAAEGAGGPYGATHERGRRGRVGARQRQQVGA